MALWSKVRVVLTERTAGPLAVWPNPAVFPALLIKVYWNKDACALTSASPPQSLVGSIAVITTGCAAVPSDWIEPPLAVMVKPAVPEVTPSISTWVPGWIVSVVPAVTIALPVT